MHSGSLSLLTEERSIPAGGISMIIFFLLLVLGLVKEAAACPLDVTVSPASGTFTTVQTVTITGTVVNQNTMSKVEFYDGGVLKGTDISSPFTLGWSITSGDNGTHNWTAKAYDVPGNVTISPVASLVVNIQTASGGFIWQSFAGGRGASDSVSPNAV